MKKLLHRYFNETIAHETQIFHLLAFFGIASGVVTSVLAIILKENLATAAIDFSVAVVSAALLLAARKLDCYRLCSWIFIVMVFFVMFPTLFFTGGGYKSGSEYIFSLAFFFTSLLLRKYERAIAIAIEFILYIGSMLLAYYKPELAYDIAKESEYFLITNLNFIIITIILLSAFLIQARMFIERHDQVRELNCELEARNETLAQYDKMKSDFLATVAHEINTPLAIIAASSSDTIDLLKETPLNMEEIIENQAIIDRRVKTIDNILLDLMDIVAIEKGRLPLNRNLIDIGELLRSAGDARIKLPDRNGNEIVYDIQARLQKVWADQQRIEQVVINLLSNAFRHSKNGIITIKLERENDRQIVSVADNGDGMDDETAKVVFTQYTSTREYYWRHGIGLAVCRRIIAAHGGEIWVESEKGRGTTISFTLSENAGYE